MAMIITNEYNGTKNKLQKTFFCFNRRNDKNDNWVCWCSSTGTRSSSLWYCDWDDGIWFEIDNDDDNGIWHVDVDFNN